MVQDLLTRQTHAISWLSALVLIVLSLSGDYPSNPLGQKLYPRHLWFHAIADVMETDGRVLPVYCDKHLSFSFVEAERMIARAERLKMPLFADSSLPFSWRLPDLELPLDCEILECIMVGCGGIDAHGYHAWCASQPGKRISCVLVLLTPPPAQ